MRTLMLVLSAVVMLGASVPSPAPIIIVDSCCLHPNGPLGYPVPPPPPPPPPTKKT